jgi:hypothetical protein
MQVDQALNSNTFAEILLNMEVENLKKVLNKKKMLIIMIIIYTILKLFMKRLVKNLRLWIKMMILEKLALILEKRLNRDLIL